MQIFAFAGVREYQAANKLAVDGDYGKECSNRAGFLTALEDEARLLIAEMDKKDLTMSDIKSSRPMASAIQEVLNLLGYEIGYQKYGADGRFGPASMQALDNFMEDQVISNQDVAVNELALQLLRLYGGVKWFRKNPAPGLGEFSDVGEGLTMKVYDRSGKTRVEVSDGNSKKEFTRFKSGLFTQGKLKVSSIDPLEFNLQKSVMKILSAVSDLEGCLDAINTWDNSFMSIGCFQWTLGTTDEDGELGDLMLSLRLTNPTFFEEKFLKYGLDVDENGECYLRSESLTLASKALIRTPEWAFRFWEACQHLEMQAKMVDFCNMRLRKLMEIEIPSAGMKIQDLFKDCLEGYAQCLQIHVNRPAYLDNIVSLAIQDTISNPRVPSAAKYKLNSLSFQTFLLDAVRERSISYGRTPVTDAGMRFDRVRASMKL